MNVLDLALLVIAVPAVIGGLRLGFLARATSWLGLALGLLVAVQLAPLVLDWFGDAGPVRQLLVAVLLLALFGVAGQLLGLVAGSRLVVALPPGPAGTADRVMGGLAGLAGVVFAAWLLLPVMAEVPQWPARQVEGSVLAGAVDRSLPEAPDALRTLAVAVGDDNWRPVLGSEMDALRQLDPPAESPVPPARLAEARRATVQIKGDNCDEPQSGAGFLAADDLVVTNAHVVAGEANPIVTDAAGDIHVGRIVVFDPKRDLAVIAVEGVDAAPLMLRDAKRGDTGVAFGFRRELLVEHPFRVGYVGDGLAPDIYGDSSTAQVRPMVGLASDLGFGDSGGPLVDAEGKVIGVTFAIGETSDVGLAIGTSAVESALTSANRLLADDEEFRAAQSACRPNRI